MSAEADYYDNLDAALEHAWQQLARAVNDRRHGFRVIQLATVAADGTPRLRSVVLRAVEPGVLQFHTDSRSHKVAEITAQPYVALLAYDARRKLQLRLSGRVTLHDDDEYTESAWAATQAMSRVCYRIQPPPGEPISSPYAVTHVKPHDNTDPGYPRFMVARVAIDQLEWLYLAHEGHRRAHWQRIQAGTGESAWQGQWLVP